MRDEYRTEKEALASSLVAIADAITCEHYNGAPLRELQRQVYTVVSNTADPFLRTLGFIIDQWIKDYYYNFAGDVMSSAWAEVETIRAKLLRSATSQALMHLAAALSADSKADGFCAIELLISSYLAAIDDANMVVERAYGRLKVCDR